MLEDDTKQNDLLDFVSSLTGGDGVRVEESLGSGYVRLRVSEAERRQAKHDIRCVEDAVIELLRNARDAGARHIFVATTREGTLRTIIVVDDGTGIPAHMQERVFEARVTSKLDTLTMDQWGVHGRGMALYSIKQSARGAGVCKSNTGLGCALKVCYDVEDITERADQSSWPQVVMQKGERVVRGPRNIIRTCTEFALECEGRCNVYVGSPSEILASMRWVGERDDSYAGDAQSAKLTVQAYRCKDARELADFGAELGMELSQRTAHRIIRGQIERQRNICALVLPRKATAPSSARHKDQRSLAGLSEEDKEEFVASLEESFKTLAQRYYLRLTATPSVRVGAGRVVVTYDFEDADGGT